MGIKQSYNDNLWKLPNEYGDVSVMVTKFLVRLNHKLVSFVTFSHGYRVIQISNFCTQTGSVRNGWKFPVAKYTELALYIVEVHVHKRRISCLSLTSRTIFKI